MKNLFVVLVMSIATFGYAQSIGVRTGINSSVIDYDGEVSDPLRSFTIGIFGDFELAQNLSISPELMFYNIGSTYEYEGYERPGTFRDKSIVQTIALPVNLKYTTGPVYFESGPQINFWLGEKYIDEEYDTTEKYDREELKASIFMWNFGTGVNVADNISVGLRYGFNISKLTTVDYTYDDPSANVWTLAVSYKL